MGLSFQEKSLWVVLVGLIASFGFYFAAVANAQPAVAEAVPDTAADVMPDQVALFVAATVILVIFQVIGHIALVIVDRRAETDERDRLIALKGTRNGAYVLATGAFFTLTSAVMTKGNFACAHVLLGFWVLAQLTETASQLVMYRREA